MKEYSVAQIELENEMISPSLSRESWLAAIKQIFLGKLV